MSGIYQALKKPDPRRCVAFSSSCLFPCFFPSFHLLQQGLTSLPPVQIYQLEYRFTCAILWSHLRRPFTPPCAPPPAPPPQEHNDHPGRTTGYQDGLRSSRKPCGIGAKAQSGREGAETKNSFFLSLGEACFFPYSSPSISSAPFAPLVALFFVKLDRCSRFSYTAPPLRSLSSPPFPPFDVNIASLACTA